MTGRQDRQYVDHPHPPRRGDGEELLPFNTRRYTPLIWLATWVVHQTSIKICTNLLLRVAKEKVSGGRS